MLRMMSKTRENPSYFRDARLESRRQGRNKLTLHVVIVLEFDDVRRRLLTLVGNCVDAFEDFVDNHLVNDAQLLVHLLFDRFLR